MRFRHPVAPVLLVLVAVMVNARPAFAAWPNQPATNLPISRAANAQYTPAIVSDGAGGAIVAWQDFRSGTNYDIYTQRILPSGVVDPAAPVDGRVVCNNAGDQAVPAIAPDGSGGGIIAWYDSRNGNLDVFAHHVLASGLVDASWLANGRQLCGAAGSQNTVVIVSDGAGGAIVAWQDFRNAANYDIYAQHVLASGAVDPGWPVDGRALCIATGDQLGQAIVSDGSGGAIVTWHDFRGGATADIYAQHVRAAGSVDSAWPADGAVICNATATQTFPRIVSDGLGGAIITWQDSRGAAPADIYAQRVQANGAVDASWPSNGRALCTATSNQTVPMIASDGAGGAVVTWSDFRSGATNDIYAGRVLAEGIVDPAWPVDGRALCTAAADQSNITIVSDGAGGAIGLWLDNRYSVNADLFAQHVLPSGVVDSAWPADGRAISTASNSQFSPQAASDGAGGAIITWTDYRAGGAAVADIYAQRVARFGYLGTPEAEIAAVRDVPNDQGGLVKVSWVTSYLDLAQDANLAAYDLYRSVPPNLAAQARANGALRSLRSLSEGALPPLRRGDLVAIPTAASVYAWEYVSTTSPNHFASQYSDLVPTAFDSVGGSNPRTAFLVLARNSSGSMFWPSRPDSGYSVDNLPPAAPAPFTGEYGAGSTSLHWNPNTESDLAGYRLYRGATGSFVPGPGNLVAALPDTGFADAAGAPYVYKLTAIDSHGNESPVAILVPGGTTGVDGTTGVGALALSPAWPNPARDRATLTLQLPSAGTLTVDVLDLTGRRLRSLHRGFTPASRLALEWDGRDDEGRPCGAGFYFVMARAGGERAVARMAWAR